VQTEGSCYRSRRSRSRSKDPDHQVITGQGRNDPRAAHYHAVDPRDEEKSKRSETAQSGDRFPEKEILQNPDVLPTIDSVAITTLPKYSATASATVTSSTCKVAVNSRKLEGPYQKTATVAVTEKSGNVSEVSLIPDFDPEGTPVRSILQGLELPDLASGKIRPLLQQAPTKPIRRDQEILQPE